MINAPPTNVTLYIHLTNLSHRTMLSRDCFTRRGCIARVTRRFTTSLVRTQPFFWAVCAKTTWRQSRKHVESSPLMTSTRSRSTWRTTSCLSRLRGWCNQRPRYSESWPSCQRFTAEAAQTACLSRLRGWCNQRPRYSESWPSCQRFRRKLRTRHRELL